MIQPYHFQNILLHLHGVKQVNEHQWEAKCPAHDDRRPSLRISPGDDGRVLMHCHAGCRLEDICSRIGIEVKDLFSPPGEQSAPPEQAKSASASARATAYLSRQDAIQAIIKQVGGRFVIEYCYKDLQGNEVFWVVRLQTPTGKTFRPVYRDEAGWRLGDPLGKLPLYRLPEIHGHNRVHICEGEKAAGAGAEIGLAAMTSAHGCKSAAKTDWGPLAGKDVIIWPDNDEPGQGYADAVVDLLRRLEPRPRIKIIDLPGLPPHGDSAGLGVVLRWHVTTEFAGSEAVEGRASPPVLSNAKHECERSICDAIREVVVGEGYWR